MRIHKNGDNFTVTLAYNKNSSFYRPTDLYLVQWTLDIKPLKIKETPEEDLQVTNFFITKKSIEMKEIQQIHVTREEKKWIFNQDSLIVFRDIFNLEIEISANHLTKSDGKW